EGHVVSDLVFETSTHHEAHAVDVIDTGINVHIVDRERNVGLAVGKTAVNIGKCVVERITGTSANSANEVQARIDLDGVCTARDLRADTVVRYRDVRYSTQHEAVELHVIANLDAANCAAAIDRDIQQRWAASRCKGE